MYWDELLNFREIQDRTSIPYWTLERLFKEKEIPSMSLSERARRKRLGDLDRIKRLYYEEGLSLNEMYQKHGTRRT
jgi:hypothetical protein